ncbi:MAG: CBS domain-containing protein [Acidobacteriota bacterium]
MRISRTMTHMPAVKSMMTPFPYSVEAAAALDDARRMMVDHHIRHLPVVENGRLVGALSDRDVDRGGEGRVRDVLLRELYVVDLDEPLDNVLLRMAERHIDAALVTREGKLAGIFTVTDACRRFCEFLRAWFPRGEDGKAA